MKINKLWQKKMMTMMMKILFLVTNTSFKSTKDILITLRSLQSIKKSISRKKKEKESLTRWLMSLLEKEVEVEVHLRERIGPKASLNKKETQSFQKIIIKNKMKKN